MESTAVSSDQPERPDLLIRLDCVLCRYVTFAGRAGLPVSETGPVQPDGIDAWPVLSALGNRQASDRQPGPHNYQVDKLVQEGVEKVEGRQENQDEFLPEEVQGNVRQEILLCGNTSWRVGEADKHDGALVARHNASWHYKLIVATEASFMWWAPANNTGASPRLS